MSNELKTDQLYPKHNRLKEFESFGSQLAATYSRRTDDRGRRDDYMDQSYEQRTGNYSGPRGDASSGA
jgi:hypothetical protein